MSATKAERERLSRFARRAYRSDPARLAVECAGCHAPAGQACVGDDGQEEPLVHTVRAFDAGLTERFEHLVGIVASLDAAAVDDRSEAWDEEEL